MLVAGGALAVAALALAASTQVTSAADKPGLRAEVDLKPTQGNTVSGKIEFVSEAGGVRVSGKLEGLKPGEHGFHVHEKGDCSAPDAASAGGHFNPMTMPHAGPDADKRHEGDLGNVTADASGKVELNKVDRELELSGANSIIGHAVIVHANADDFTTQPTGNAGGRVACGVIREVSAAR
jgi:Cu-Zn family superoxide dismutase